MAERERSQRTAQKKSSAGTVRSPFLSKQLRRAASSSFSRGLGNGKSSSSEEEDNGLRKKTSSSEELEDVVTDRCRGDGARSPASSESDEDRPLMEIDLRSSLLETDLCRRG